jgi:hypothetical protein
MTPLTRRAFVQRTGLAVGAAGTLGWQAGSAGAASRALSPARQATFAAVVGAIHTANGRSMTAAQARRAARSFGEDYAAIDGGTRRYIDGMLDELERSEAGGFAAAGRRRQIARLRQLRHGRAQRRRAYAAAAIELASAPSQLTSDIKPAPLPI